MFAGKGMSTMFGIENGGGARSGAGVSPEPRAGFDRISLRRLVLIRWIAVAGQAVSLLVVHFLFDFQLPLLPAFAVVFCSVLLNLFIIVHRRAATRLGEREAAGYLAFDLLQLALLLYLTGGLENPFSILILAPVTVAATILSQRSVVPLAIFAITTITVLALWHLPLPWRAEPPLVFPGELVLGIWTSLVCATVFIGGYTWSVAEEARRLRDAVAATQLALAREQRVSAVGALAAAAAHELGSPLATIAVVAKELVHDLPPDSPHAEDAMLLLSQSERCREILAQLARQPAEDGASPYTRLPISALVEASGTLYRDPRVRLIFATTGDPAGEPLVSRSPEIMHGLNNLIQNAVQFARSEVSVTISWDKDNVTVEVADDGPGFPAHLLGRLGEPYLSTRAGASNHMGLHRAKPVGAQRRRSGLRQSCRGRGACCHFLESAQFGGNGATRCRGGGRRIGRGAIRNRETAEMNTSERPLRTGAEGEAAPLRGLSEADRTLLIVDDDAPLCQRLARAMERRGFVVATAESVATGMALAKANPPAFAVVDLRLGDGSGLDVVSAVRGARPGARIVMLTGYGNIATAVAAVKAGALDYLPKPASGRCWPRRARRRRPRRTRCRPIGCAGSTFSGSSNYATATSRRRRAGSRCIAAPCSGSLASTRRAAEHAPL